ncbi:MAG: MerR family transcriptional regulator, partial [Patescibacteria group bacterium]
MKLLTIKEASTALKVTEKTLRRWEEKKFITPIRTTGRHRRYSPEQLKSVKKFKNKKKVDISEVRHLLSNEIDQVFTNSPLIDVNYPKISRPNFVRSFALKSLAVILFSAGALTAYKVKSDQKTNISVFEPEVVNQSVLAATSFRDAEFSINIPTILNSTLTLGNDTISDFTGDGLSVVNGALTAEVSSLGDDITSAEIVDGTISEVDLLSSNTPNNSQLLSFNSTTGGFTWTNQITDTVGTNYFTDGGDITYLTATGDDFALGGTNTSSPFYFDTENRIINLTKTAAGKWINFSDGTDVWGLYNRAGTPEGFITANTGTLAMDTANGTLYVKTDDGDATDWTNLATGVTSPFSETAGLVTLTNVTSNVNVGGSSDLGKLAVDGDTDEIQLLVQGNGTQTSNLAVFENSTGANLLSLSNTAGLTLGSDGVDGSLSLYNELGATDYSVNFQTSSNQTGNVTYTLPVDDGAADNYVLTTDGSGLLTWESVGGIGGMASFTLSGDSGSDQTISDVNTLEIAGGVTGIDTATSATDVITLDIDTTEIGENTWGNNTDASIVWTFDQSGTTDPTLAFSDGLVTVGGDLAISGGNITTAVTADSTLTVTGTTTTNGTLTANGVITLGDNGDTVAVNSSDWDINTTGDMTGIGSITIDGRFDTAAHNNNNGLNLPTSAGAPSAVTGTAEGDIVYDTTGNNLYIYDGGSFTQVGGGGYSGWTIDGDDADTEAIASGNTLLVAGGTNGIDTDVSA